MPPLLGMEGRRRGDRGRRGNRILGGNASCTRKTDQAMKKEVGNFLRKQLGNRHPAVGMTRSTSRTKTPLRVVDILRHTQNTVESRH